MIPCNSRRTRSQPRVRREMISIRDEQPLRMAIGSCTAIFAFFLLGCSTVRNDTQFAHDFLIELKSGDSSIASKVDPAVLADAGSWKVLDTSLQARLPATAIDSIIFVSREAGSSLPPTVRIVTMRVFGGRQYSIAAVYLETVKNGQTLVYTIRVQGPLPMQ